MDYKKNLYTVENMKTIIAEIDTLDKSIQRKSKFNIAYTNFLNKLSVESINNLYIIIKNLKTNINE